MLRHLIGALLLAHATVALGQDQGPRFGSFVALYGIANTRALIARAMGGELAR